MNPLRPSQTWHGSCTGCGQPFTEWGWSWRHDVSDADARHHHITPGEYHEQCCPLQTCATDEAVAS